MLSSMSVLSVGLSVCPLVTNVYFAKTAESIEMPFGVTGWLGLRYNVVNRSGWQIGVDGRNNVMERTAMQPLPKLFEISC